MTALFLFPSRIEVFRECSTIAKRVGCGIVFREMKQEKNFVKSGPDKKRRSGADLLLD
jgi:hypothetical protein